ASVSGCAAIGVAALNSSAEQIAPAASDAGLARNASSRGPARSPWPVHCHSMYHSTVGIAVEMIRQANRQHVQKLSEERTAMTQAFGRMLPSLLGTPPPGRTMYCSSGCSIHHGASCP